MQQVVLGNPPAVLLQMREHIVLVVVHDWQGFLHTASLQGLLIPVHYGEGSNINKNIEEKETVYLEFD